MKFKIQQVALCPLDVKRAEALLAKLGLDSWARDTVVATGTVHGVEGSNRAQLAFNYDALDGNELELLHYTDGRNWMADTRPAVSHLGMHCTEDELAEWKKFFELEGIGIVQEVYTQSHTNKFLRDNGRKYHYCIFGTRDVLGTDLKFIVRIDPAEPR